MKQLVLAMLLTAAAVNANANLQVWHFNRLSNVNGVLVGIFVYDTSRAKIIDWDIDIQSIDPLWGELNNSVGSFDKHFQSFFTYCGDFPCNSGDLVSPTRLRFTSGTRPQTMASIDIVLGQPLPSSGGFVPVLGGSYTFFDGQAKEILPGFVFSTPVPEPQAALAFALGLIGLLTKYSKHVVRLARV